MDRSKLGGVILFVGAIGLIVAAFSHSWWTYPGSTNFGLLSADVSGEGTLSYSTLIEQSYALHDLDTFMWIGRVLFGVIMLACLAGLSTVWTMLAGHARYQWTYFVAALAGIIGIGLMSKRPDLMQGAGASWSLYSFWVGALATFAGDLLRVVDKATIPAGTRPAQQRQALLECPQCSALMPLTSAACGSCGWSKTSPLVNQPALPNESLSERPPIPPPATTAARLSPACPRCRAPTSFVGEFQRFFCERCNAYLEP